MSRFSQIARGPQQIEAIEILFPGVEKPVALGLRILGTDDDDEILKGARDFAIKTGIANPKDGDPIYDVALARETIARGCVDLDDKTSPFFASAEEVRVGPDGKGGLDRDRIAYLFAKQQAWQDRCSPSAKHMSPGQFIAKVIEIAALPEGDESFLDSLRPCLVASFLHTISKEFVTLATLKSPSLLDSKPSIESASKNIDS